MHRIAQRLVDVALNIGVQRDHLANGHAISLSVRGIGQGYRKLAA
jgi:hypothetical protein